MGRVRFIINVITAVAVMTAYSYSIAEAYSINIMFPSFTVCDKEDADNKADTKEVRFKIVEIVRDLFE